MGATLADALRVLQGASLVARHLASHIAPVAEARAQSVATHGGEVGRSLSVLLSSLQGSGLDVTPEERREAEKAAAGAGSSMGGVDPSFAPQRDMSILDRTALPKLDGTYSSTPGHSFGQSNQANRSRSVPSTPLSRVLGFGQLAAGLAAGTVAEVIRTSVAEGLGPGSGTTSAEGRGPGSGNQQDANTQERRTYVMNDANADRLAEALCRMRGAALKLGQMLSIQDERILPPQLVKALQRVRSGAYVMPESQLHHQLETSLGANWRDAFAEFDEAPMAAASIGQVHTAELPTGEMVAVKIQYPGVADSIESDLRNLERLVTVTNVMPPGMFIDEVVDVAREELVMECNYQEEMAHQQRFSALVETDPVLAEWVRVPPVVAGLSAGGVLTTHFAKGVTVDKVAEMPQEVRNHVARLLLRTTIKEVFEWRFMQTDPNWGNFLFDPETAEISLIDFGACREYDSSFVDRYMELVWAAANQDTDQLIKLGIDLEFLTGDESAAMMEAHALAGLVVGEPFLTDEPFDFHASNITERISTHGATFLQHRLTPPPREAYSLHRKLAGAFLLCIKLKAVIPCRDILTEAVNERRERQAQLTSEPQKLVQQY
ncbi:unnamed protein product [Chrysoparadoxa australica]